MNKQIFPEILLIVFLFGIRIYSLEPGHFYDYDAVSNYLVIREITEGNWQHVFQHASPGFYTLMLPFYWICGGLFCLQYLSVICNLASLFFFIYYFYKQTNIQKPAYKLLLYLFIGTSFFSVNSAFYFTIENPSVLLFLLCIQKYHQSLHQGNKHLIISAFLWGLLYTINYKAILLLPIFWLLEMIQKKRRASIFTWFWAITAAISPILFCILIGMLAGVPYWKYPAVIYLTLTATSSGGMGSQFGADVWYYCKYLIYFENPLLLPGLGLFLYWHASQLPQKLKEGSLTAQLFFFCLCFFLGMSLLLKAPRGLAFIYPCLYGLSWLGWVGLWQKLKNRTHTMILRAAFIGSLGWALFRVYSLIYPFALTHYPEVAQYLKNHQIDKIAVTVGLKIIPPAKDKNLEIKVIRHENELVSLIEAGYEYVLLDDFYQVVKLHYFEQLEQIPPLKEWKEPSLLAPMLHLEHSEFTRLSFEQSLALRDSLAQNKYHLHLIKIPAESKSLFIQKP